MLKSGKGTYPVGTMILKQKFLDAGWKENCIFTLECEKSEGTGIVIPLGPDWEFFMLDAQGQTVNRTRKNRIMHGLSPTQFQPTRFFPRDGTESANRGQ